MKKILLVLVILVVCTGLYLCGNYQEHLKLGVVVSKEVDAKDLTPIEQKQLEGLFDGDHFIAVRTPDSTIIHVVEVRRFNLPIRVNDTIHYSDFMDNGMYTVRR